MALVASLSVGYAMSRSGGTGVDAEFDRSTPTQLPTIGTNRPVDGLKLADVALTTADGTSIQTADLLGQPLVINYWYSTCLPCKKELPAFAAVDADFSDQVRFVGVNPLDPDLGQSFAADRGVRYELFGDPDGEYTSAVGIVTAPVTLFVAADGTIVRQTGELNEQEIRAILAEECGISEPSGLVES